MESQVPEVAAVLCYNETVRISTPGRALVDITAAVQGIVSATTIDNGLCSVYIHHTSASLVISENADPDVCRDLEAYLARIVQDGDPRYAHDAEGPDDMAAHIRSALTLTSVSIPVKNRRLALGTWQALYLWEHRYARHTRSVTITTLGTSA